ncbi:hypothetical protein BO94DRAFT_570588 [Aspergillus sclerotioniger CBS 115572]|uniref:Uncharacterized protein n=1 Tax=Aspergillus sclerotioniger CBS 115572 TaxID=1450535 RepID=A0A317XCH7_9EURO|nr:hypothetical protein BO94DRAFT_570588 [Aspergillus sclerotioniger CBS 115572]PWY96243.1 hypothetical protein BO94DRAFT_570588 [Aspergillus sclerotioniger CBS 115572]
MGDLEELTDKKAQLICQLSEITGLTNIGSPLFATLWFSDDSVLENHHESAKRDPSKTRFLLQDAGNQLLDILKLWSSRFWRDYPERIWTRITNLNEPRPPHWEIISFPPVQPGGSLLSLVTCHPWSPIAPSRAIFDPESGTAIANFWSTLRMFWSSERVDSWQRATIGGTKRCSNLISLALHIHDLWDKAVFGLRPLELSSNRETLTVQLHWLQSSSYARQISMTSRPSFPANLQGVSNSGAGIYNLKTKMPVSSGDKMIFETDDPDGRPLPSLELLDMQWVLHRVLALSGVPSHGTYSFHR